MREDIKQKIEKLVLKDIDYILHYKPIAKGAESAQHFSNMTIIKPIALNVYPQIYVDLVKRFEKDEAIRRLRNLGYRVAKFYYSSFPNELKKPQKFSKIFSEVGKKHMDEKVIIENKIEIYKKLKSCNIKIEHCIFCSDITPFENLDIPFCIAKTGFYENLYNIKSLYNRDMEPRLVQVDSIRSARFDGDYCEYKLTVID
ncbi:MAG: hypothetical protein ACFFDN_35110 [Candidatus Hodarchaeota archaeon]